MSSREEKKKRLKEKSKRSVQRTNELLAGELKALQKASKADLKKLCPKMTAPVTYDKLIKEVKKSTRKNESIAQLKTRLETLGKVGAKTVKKAITELAKLK